MAALIDLGAEENLISRSLAAALAFSKQLDSFPSLEFIDGFVVSTDGYCKVRITITDDLGTTEMKLYCFIVSAQMHFYMILGMLWLEAVNLAIHWGAKK